MKLGAIIKRYRSENNLSQDDIARRSGLSKAYISILERNINPSTGREPVPTMDTIAAVSRAIGEDFDTVYGWIDPDSTVSFSRKPVDETDGVSVSGERIRDIRRKRGLTQEQLAEKLGVKKQTIFKYENGVIANIPPDRILAIANLLSVSPSYLMGWDDNNQTAPPRNVLKIAGRDGSYEEHTLTDGQLAAVRAMVDQFPDAEDDRL